jgi:hypothetical protein
MADATMAGDSFEPALDVSPAGAAELSRRSMAAPVADPRISSATPASDESRSLDEILLDRVRHDLSSAYAGPARVLPAPSLETIENLEISVRDGVVTLRGQVRNYEELRGIESRVHRVEGVQDVRNELQIWLPPVGQGR